MPRPGRAHPRIYLVRHGETEWARTGRHTGTTDAPLTDRGREQARQIAARLEGLVFDAAMSSPLSRALDTARIAGFGEVVVVDPDLREWDYGEYEGLTTPQIRKRVAGWSIWQGPVPGGETIEEVGARADRVVERLGGLGGDAVLFAHGHLLRVLAARWLGLAPSEGRLFALATATISVLGWDRETRVVERWNETCGAR